MNDDTATAATTNTVRRALGPFSVGPVGLGCMNICHAYGQPLTETAALALLQRALDLGVDHFDTAALYGFGASERLVGRAIRGSRSRITLASKGGMAGVTGSDGVTRRVIDGRPEAIQRHCEDSLQRLGTDVIDLYYLHRWDQAVPVEDSVGALARLVEQGKVRAIGLSEVSAPTLRRAHAVHPIAAVQTEYSLWTRNPEIAVLQACRDIGAAFVAFSPLARAFLTDTLHDPATLDDKDLRRAMPRFQPAAYAANLKLLPPYVAIAREAGCSPAQLALAWLLAQGEHVHVIPGTSSTAHLADNLGAAAVRLTPDQVRRLDALINPRTVSGVRYTLAAQADVDTEDFAPR
ncbi:MAG: aldo/keto reductase [Proteobacteria bacterium]|nr:aldo/keto reductase [Pseudomonadota bacterium]